MENRKSKSENRMSKLALLVGVALSFTSLLGQEQAPSESRRPHSNIERVVPFVPTPMEIVEKMLVMAKVDKTDVVYDLGSGDGRVVIMAAKKFGARAVGVELDPKLYEDSSKKVADLGLSDRAKILYGNFFDTNVHPATVVTLYLLTVVNERLRPKLEKELRPGARIVSHDFEVRGWTPDKIDKVTSDNGISHTLYLYVRPL